MQAPPGQMTAPALQALLKDGALAGEWVLGPRRSSIRLKTSVMWGLAPVNGDTHLRSATFLDSANHPDITFTAHGIRPSGQGVVVTGALTVRGRTRPLSFAAAVSVQGDGELWLDAEVHVNRADFGLTLSLMGVVSTDNTLTVHAVFTRR